MQPLLYGLNNSNHDWTERPSWGKNVFNNAFPMSLIMFMYSKGLAPVYLKVDDNLNVIHSTVSDKELFNCSFDNPNIFFDFESGYEPFEKYVSVRLPRIDVVVRDKESKEPLSALEVKLTTLPDNSTCKFNEDRYSTEIVCRPDTIVYIALSIIKSFESNPHLLKQIVSPTYEKIENWRDRNEIENSKEALIKVIDDLMLHNATYQTPIIVQPVWKTVGKSARLAEDSFDVFIWSNYAFTRLFLDSSRNANDINRNFRSIIWLSKMLWNYVQSGDILHQETIDDLSFNTRNDKAFAASGIVTYSYLKSPELSKPRISKEALKEIILGGGEELLSPERRLDAVIQASDLFN